MVNDEPVVLILIDVLQSYEGLRAFLSICASACLSAPQRPPPPGLAGGLRVEIKKKKQKQNLAQSYAAETQIALQHYNCYPNKPPLSCCANNKFVLLFLITSLPAELFCLWS